MNELRNVFLRVDAPLCLDAKYVEDIIEGINPSYDRSQWAQVIPFPKMTTEEEAERSILEMFKPCHTREGSNKAYISRMIFARYLCVYCHEALASFDNELVSAIYRSACFVKKHKKPSNEPACEVPTLFERIKTELLSYESAIITDQQVEELVSNGFLEIDGKTHVFFTHDGFREWFGCALSDLSFGLTLLGGSDSGFDELLIREVFTIPDSLYHYVEESTKMVRFGCPRARSEKTLRVHYLKVQDGRAEVVTECM